LAVVNLEWDDEIQPVTLIEPESLIIVRDEQENLAEGALTMRRPGEQCQTAAAPAPTSTYLFAIGTLFV